MILKVALMSYKAKSSDFKLEIASISSEANPPMAVIFKFSIRWFPEKSMFLNMPKQLKSFNMVQEEMLIVSNRPE